MNLYFVIVLCFIIIQVGSAISGFMSGSSWIYDALEQSWDRAYQKDKSLIHDLQLEFSCRGFHSAEDRAVHISEDMDMPLPACGQVLLLRFGKRLQRLGLLIFCIRLIQLTGVFLLSILFKHLASTVQSEEGEENEADEESPYFPSEKLLEEESARIPLLSMEDYDLPHYSVHDEPVGDENDDDDDDDDENDDGHRASCTGVVWGARSCHTHFDNHDYSYYGLPEYAEDERETQHEGDNMTSLVVPYCFCQKPAVELSTQDFGIVFECYNTHYGPDGQSKGSASHLQANNERLRQDTSQSGQQREDIHPTIGSADITNMNSSAMATQNSSDANGLGQKKQPSHQSNYNAWLSFRPPKPSDHVSPIHEEIRHSGQRPPPITHKGKEERRICGFHMHSRDWIKFINLIWNPELARTTDSILAATSDEGFGLGVWEQSRLLAERHQDIVRKHPSVYLSIILLANACQCRAQLASVARWLELESVLEFPELIGKPPRCFCGKDMVLRSAYHDLKPTTVYACADSRLGGCSRVLEARTLRLLPPSESLHTLADFASQKHTAPEQDKGKGPWDPSSYLSHDGNERNPPTPCFGDRKAMAGASSSRSESDYDDSHPEDPVDGREGAHSANSAKSSEDDLVSEQLKVTPNAALPLPPGLIRVNERVVRAAVTRNTLLDKREEDSMQNTLQHNGHGSGSEAHDIAPVREHPMTQLAAELDQFNRGVIPRRRAVEAQIQELEGRLAVWQESAERLEKYATELQECGFDNPKLTCRACKTGTLAHAIVPCYHLVMCDACLKTHRLCIVCKAPIQQLQRVFWG
ncbi:hypothetical protein BGW38_001151 [Lunasporangiospora selenospora]|uniref:RING-type domain-containing protein n=1 Tax=Lunasporangiospora selenospora TaxID=979761 RepID=A0A9P6G2A1_9FUNG|nr:hypothetical protein BGW38_001151 [Lunasporangiospora selenospora]